MTFLKEVKTGYMGLVLFSILFLLFSLLLSYVVAVTVFVIIYVGLLFRRLAHFSAVLVVWPD